MAQPDPQDRFVTARSLPAWAVASSGALLGLPMLALALVPSYARRTPQLWGFPFFYWYQFLWVFLAAGCTYAAHVIVVRARNGRSGEGR